MEVIEINGNMVGILSVQEMQERTLAVARGEEVDWPTLKFFAASVENAREMMKIEVGDLAEHKITGFKGIVVAYLTCLHNCDRVDLQPQELKDGEVQKVKGFDVPMMRLLEKHVVEGIPCPDHKFHLGDTVKDQLSPCTGTIVILSEHISGCVQAVVQPSELKDGTPVTGMWLPISQLDLEKKAETPAVPRKNGGPVREARAYMS